MVYDNTNMFAEENVKQSIKQKEADIDRLQTRCVNLEGQVDSLKELLADEVIINRCVNEGINDANRDLSELQQRMWRIKEILLDPENKIRMSKEIAEKIFKLLP